MAEEKASTNKRREQPAPTKADKVQQTQEAKDLRSLINLLGEKNSPETSKDVTAYAKETMRIVAKSQKSDSDAFKREATKALIDFREFVEKTDKVTELRRTKLLNDIDSVQLDVKNTTFMLLSVAKNQAENIKKNAKAEAAAQKLRLRMEEKQSNLELNIRAKTIIEEAKMRAKTIEDEKILRFKDLAKQRSEKHKLTMDEGKLKIKEAKDRLSQSKDNHKAKVAKDRLDIADSRKKAKKQYDDLKVDLKQKWDLRNAALAQQKAQQQANNAKAQLDLKQARTDAALKIKKLKTDLRDNYQTKMRASKADIAQKKSDMATANKARIQKIRLMTAEHAKKLKLIEQDAKGEAILRKNALRQQLRDQQTKADKKKAMRAGITSKVKDGFFDANPIIHAMVEVATGIYGFFNKKDKDPSNSKRQPKSLNKLNHTSQKPSTAIRAGNPTPGSGQAPGGAASGGAGGGSASMGILGTMVSDIIGGITSFFTTIVSTLSGVGKLLAGGLRFMPAIAAVATIVSGVISFIEGFNDASSLFGEKVQDRDYLKRVYSGFVNVVGSIVGIFDTVAGWMGFDIDLKSKFKDGAVKLFNIVMDAFNGIIIGFGDIIEKIPGMGGFAKILKAYGPKTGEVQVSVPNTAAVLGDKTNTVNTLRDEVEAKKSAPATTQIVQDNSVRQNSTTFVAGKLDTRNTDPTIQMYGGLGS